MRYNNRVNSSILCFACLALLLAAPAAWAGAAAPGSAALANASRHTLQWTPDPAYVVTSGLSHGMLVSRAQALRILARMNAGEVENFGRSDWRLPTARELAAHMAAAGMGPGSIPTLDAKLFSAWLAAQVPQTGTHLGAKPFRAGQTVVLWPVAGAAIEPGFPDVVVFGSNSVYMKNSSKVVSGDVVANDASPGPTLVSGYEMGMDPKSSTPAGYTVKADSVRIKNKAVAGGDVAYNDLNNKGTIGGTEITPLSLPVFAELPPFFSGTPGATPVSVPDGGYATLPAGDYGAVTVGEDATLAFDGGTYNVASITAGDGASLLFEAASEVRVDGRFLSGQGDAIGPDSGSGVTAHDVVFYVEGINGSDGAIDSTPLAAVIGHTNAVSANFYAPNGTLMIGHGSDATGAFLGRDVLVDVQAQVTLDSYFFNRPPVAVDDSATVDEGGTVSVLDSGETSLLANDSDPNLDNLTVTTTPVSGPSHGTLTLNADGTFSYTHDGSETTSDSFVYEVCDDGSPVLCSTATVSITVIPVNDPPVAADDSATVVQGSSVSVLDSGETSLLANDTDPDSTVLTVTTTPVSGPSHGSVTLNSDGTFTYTNNGDEVTSDSFVYEVCDDGSPALCDTATVSITVQLNVTVTVFKFGLGTGSVTSSPAGINCGSSCSHDFPPGTGPITLSAVPDAGSTFGGWVGAPDCADGVLTEGVDVVCQARFDLEAVPPATLTITLSGTGSGTVESTPSGISCPGTCSAGFPVPTRVYLDAFPDANSEFVGWAGDADCSDGIVDLTAVTSCTAIFNALPPPPATYNLTIIFLGNGAGTVASSPLGINCSGDCTASFTQGTNVTLFTRPSLGSLTGWGGDCSGASFSTSVTLDSDKTCTVTFIQ